VIVLPKPDGIPYEDLTLVTPDKVSLRCYLFPQKKQLGVRTEDDDAKTNDEDTIGENILHEYAV
ncbi:hypothetical protein C0992_009560, partial [Termitomyces sp. T32_za158]